MLYMLLFWVSLKDRRKTQEKARDHTNGLSYIPSEKKSRTGISGCGSFVVYFFQPATSINHLHLALPAVIRLCHWSIVHHV